MQTIIEPQAGSGVRRAFVVAVVVVAVAASFRRPRGQAQHDRHLVWSGADHGHTVVAS